MPQLSQTNLKRFGEKLRALRRQRGMTMKELALALGLTSYSYISELETGKKEPTARFVLNAANLFDVTTDQLLKDELDLDG
jgi:transcriptional regulator with XRE-family HTH domain